MSERLFVYGSLQPGGPNEHVLSSLQGQWEPASVRGTLVEDGWGATLGFPALIVDKDGGEVSGYVLTAAGLRQQWDYLDAFEGDGYERKTVAVTLADGEIVQANVYVLRRGMP